MLILKRVKKGATKKKEKNLIKKVSKKYLQVLKSMLILKSLKERQTKKERVPQIERNNMENIMTNTIKVTKRDFYNEIINGTEITQEMKDFAKDLIEKMDLANEKKKASPKVRELTDEQKALNLSILDMLLTAECPATAKELANAIGDVSVQKVSARLKYLVASGQVKAIEPAKRKDPMLYEMVA